MIRQVVTYLCFALFFISCRKENALDCFKSNGKEVSEMRYPGPFREVEVNDKIEVTIYQGTEYKVEVLAGAHVLKNISTKIENGILKIDNNNRCNFVRGYKRQIKMNITVPSIEKVTNNGVATLRFGEEFSQDTLLVRAENSGDIYVNGTFNEIRTSSHGNGDIYLQGSANRLYVYSYGTNYLQAADLAVSDYVFIETVSIGDCYVNATSLNALDYHIASDGNIYYTGDPGHINSNINDGVKGRLIRKD
jgi:hypothetical protein